MSNFDAFAFDSDDSELSDIAEMREYDDLFDLLADHGRSTPSLAVAELVPDTLVRYYTGILSEAMARQLETRLTLSAGDRETAAHCFQTITALKALPIAEVRRASEEHGSEAAIARAWLRCTRHQLYDPNDDPFYEVRESNVIYNVDRGWTIWQLISDLALAGRAEAHTLKTTLTGFADQVRLAAMRPGMAAARGLIAEQPRVVGARLECRFDYCDIDEDGTLRCKIRFDEETPESAKSGKLAVLHLVSAGFLLPVASAPIIDQTAEWVVEQIGVLIGVVDGPPPVNSIAISIQYPDLISLSIQANPEWSTLPGSMFASIANSTGLETGRVPAEVGVEILPATVERSHALSVSVRLPEITRKAYADAEFILEFAVAPDIYQRLGSWPIREWRDGARILTFIDFFLSNEMTPAIICLRPRIQLPPAT